MPPRPSPSPALADPFSALDPSLHPATLHSIATSRRSPSPPDTTRLTDFAQHILGETGFGELLEAAREEENQREIAGVGDGPGEDHGLGHGGGIDVDVDVDGEGEGGEFVPEGEDVDVPPPPPRAYGGRKRRREDVEGVDPVRSKKDSHKEVERRRRDNINDGLTELASLLPEGAAKRGKSELLRHATRHLAEVNAKAYEYDRDMAKRDAEKAELQAELEHTRASVSDERKRSIRFETSWREAENRAAQSQFELQRVKQELEDLRKSLG
ncbi:hypothetical protein BCR39DRAFT_528616 [Naematelia encephala]|uniref:BHLH domain-containing protein n=1 Tax=Naematelia encephala TaxID=71784 RepID=A0A1Y2B6S9_9TREE|nr:hypothetical protein BCR39DRAFT_528616 [Naematelia encephala]